MKRRMLVLLAAIVAAVLAMVGTAQAQSIDAVPGCAEYFGGYVYTVNGWQPSYRAWCGSDEWGWYDPTQWCIVSGYCFTDYGISDE